jgi:hypothetical protein
MKHFVYVLVEGENIHYVGYSASLEQRRKAHASEHPSWRMLTLGAYLTSEIGLDREKWWIKRLLESGHPLTNISEGGDPGYPLGQSVSYLTRARRSAAKKGHTASLETRAKMSAAMMGNQNALGHERTDEERANISAKMRDHDVSPETRAKMSVAQTKRFESPEERTKISMAKRGQIPWNRGRTASHEARDNQSKAHKGKPWSLARREAYERKYNLGIEINGGINT